MAIDPVSIGSAALGTLSGIFQGFGAKKRLDKTLKYQKEAQEDAQAHNLHMAQLSNQWARENIADERAYNDPSKVRERLAKAGLNPDLMYAGGAGSLIDSNVAATFQPQSVQPLDPSSAIMSTPTVGESIITGISAAKMLAETQNIKADTAKKQGEQTSLDLDNMVKSATQGSTIELANMQVSLSKSVLDLNSAQKENLLQGIKNLETANDKMNAEIENIVSSTKNIDSVTLNNRLEHILKGKRFALEVQQVRQNLKESDARINLSETEVKRMMLLMLSEKMSLDMNVLSQKAGIHLTNQQTENAVYQKDLIKFTGRQIQFNYEQDMKYSDVQRSLETVRLVTDGVSNVLGSLNPISKILQPAPTQVKGFGR